MTTQCLEIGCTSPADPDSHRLYPLCRHHDWESKVRSQELLIEWYGRDIAAFMADARKLKRIGKREHEVRVRVGQARMTNHERLKKRRFLKQLQAA